MIENKADEMLYYIDIMYVNNNYLLSTNSEMGFCFSSSSIQSDLSVMSATVNFKNVQRICMCAYRFRAYINICLCICTHAYAYK